MSKRSKTNAMRVSEEAIKIVHMIAAQMQLSTGANVSADTALMDFFERHYDDLPDNAQAIIDELKAKADDE